MLSAIPSHSAVDWDRVATINGVTHVETKCLHCGIVRWENAVQVRYRIRKGTYTGRCYRDRLVGQQRAGRRDMPLHPAVNWGNTDIHRNGRQRYRRVEVTCPTCHASRWLSATWIETRVKAGTFSGNCKLCGKTARRTDWVEVSPGRRIAPNGYVYVFPTGVSHEERSLFDATRGTQGAALEHRLAMAVALGRPLTPMETVHHRNGQRDDNVLPNLELWSKSQPAGQRVEDKISWALSLIAGYAQDRPFADLIADGLKDIPQPSSC